MKKIVKRIFYITVIVLILFFTVLYIYLKSSVARTSGNISVKGIKENVVIIRNKFGIPKIKANNKDDMFFAIGYIHASDRLFQMDMIRRLATGRLSEVMGKRTLNIDKRYKDLMVEESIENSLKTEIRKDMKRVLDSYCRGVNYFIHSEKLPPEFKLLGYKPEDWEIKDILSIFKNMENILAGSGYELSNYRTVKALGKDIASILIPGTFGTTIINNREYDACFENKSLSDFSEKENDRVENGVGSNNWVISGKKTKSGLPMLANDPHLSNVFPSYFYQIFATDGKVELSGNTIAGVPFIVIGRNKTIGWGFTNVGSDVIDYFILETDKKKENYKLDGKWEKFTYLEKRIKVKGEKDYIHKIRISKFGQVFEEDGKLLARHSIMLYKSTVLNAFYGMNFAESITDFLSALKQFSSPAQNVVFADTLGNIGYYPTGFLPKRRKGDGSFPISVTKSEEAWDGFIDENKKPFLINPKKGYIITANNPVIKTDKLPLFAIHWFPSFRADRIDELLRNKTEITVDDIKKIQTDTYMKNAEYLLSLIEKFKFEDKKADFVLDKFKKWNYRADKGIEPYLFYKFQNILSKNIFFDDIKEKKYKKLISRTWFYRITNYPKKLFTKEAYGIIDDKNTDKVESFKDIALRSLIETYNIYKKNGEEMSKWRNAHTLFYKHPLGSVPIIKTLLNRGPYFMRGGKDCIMTASFSNRDYKISHLSTFRMIMDFSDFKNSKMVNSSGQSGHFMSSFYDDQIRLYTNGLYRNMEDFEGKFERLILKPTEK